MIRSLRVATLAVLLGGVAVSTSAASPRRAEKVVRFHGLGLRVPARWPVYDLGAHASVCVRFDRHAVYLGTPGRAQRCPAHAVGRTEAILVSPPARMAGAALGPALPGGDGRSSAQLTVHGLRVTATWGRSVGTVAQVLGAGRLAAARRAAAARSSGPVASGARAVPRAHAATAVVTGLGFDPCATPSAAAMSAWKASPYRTVGIYVGGANLACSQPNLTAAWVRQESAAGWHFIPTYVGLQAPTSSCGCATIEAGSAAAEGRAAASDAIARAQAVGIGRGSPIYFDMEAYTRTASATSLVRSFLAAWTSRLHGAGYVSGVYSSAASGVRDLVAVNGTGYPEPDDIWIANWNGAQTTSDPYVPSLQWGAHQRLHQYTGGHNATYGGVTINIDSDYLDGAVAGAPSLFPDARRDPTFCVVPALRGKTLAQAKRALGRAHCRLGPIRRPRYVHRNHTLRVVAQSPKAKTRRAADYKVGVSLA